MILIGLTGGSCKNRELVTKQLLSLDLENSSQWKFDSSWDDDKRYEFLTTIMKPSHRATKTTVIHPISSEKEAKWFRDYDGYVWHVAGAFSDIRFVTGKDLFVSTGNGLKSPWLTPEEAVSEVVKMHGDRVSNERDARIAAAKKARFLQGLEGRQNYSNQLKDVTINERN